MPSGRFVRAKQLQQESTDLLKDISATGETCYITEDGKARAVLMDISRYNALMDLVEESEAPKAEEVPPESRETVSVKGILRHTTRITRRKRS